MGVFNKKTGKYDHFSKGMDAWLGSLTVDRSGIIWLGNQFQGIYKLNPDAKKFSAFSVKKGDEDVLKGKLIQITCQEMAIN